MPLAPDSILQFGLIHQLTLDSVKNRLRQWTAVGHDTPGVDQAEQNVSIAHVVGQAPVLPIGVHDHAVGGDLDDG